MKPILFLDDSLASRKALTALQAVDFPFVMDFQGSPLYKSPALVYNSKVISSGKSIENAAYKYEETKDLHTVFFPEKTTETTKSSEKKSSSKTIKANKELGYALIGYLIGGLWIITIDLFIQLTAMTQVILLLLIPTGVLGWPYYFPWIKEWLKEANSQRKN